MGVKDLIVAEKEKEPQCVLSRLLLLLPPRWAVPSLIAPAASAMPISGLAPAANALATDVQQAAWVCGPFRCWWRPGWGYGYRRYWGPRPYWGWRRRWW